MEGRKRKKRKEEEKGKEKKRKGEKDSHSKVCFVFHVDKKTLKGSLNLKKKVACPIHCSTL